MFDDDTGRLEDYIAAACARVPILGTAGIKTVINGPIPYAPDGNPLVGPAPGLPGFFHCCAFTFGIAQAGGAGKVIAEWVACGQPEWDMWPLDSRRHLEFANHNYTLAKAIETYQHEYGIGYPAEERPAGRPAKCSPAYLRLKAKGARFGARGGWERAVYFPQAGDLRDGPDVSFRRPAWHASIARECKAVQERVSVLDLPGFTKFEVTGQGATAWLDRMVAGTVPRPGRTALNYICAPNGGIVTEMTVTSLAADRYWLISAAAGERHDEHWLRAHLPSGGDAVRVENVSARHDSLIVVGPVEHILSIYDLIREAGERFGISDCGLYAMDSLRLEKCYRAWKGDLTTEYTPLMASLDRFVKLDKPGGFIGQEALRREAATGPRERFVPLVVDAADADAAAVSIVHAGDTQVGLVTSGGYGYRLNQSIALAYVRADLAVPGTELEVEILGSRRRAVVGREPLYDPGNERLRA